jgi:hypothetical protein
MEFLRARVRQIDVQQGGQALAQTVGCSLNELGDFGLGTRKALPVAVLVKIRTVSRPGSNATTR